MVRAAALRTWFRQTPFLRDSLTLISGTALAQIISIAAVPAVARLYGPTEYGLLGLIMAITGLSAIGATLQYSRAVLLPTDDASSAALVQGSILIAILFSLALMAAMMAFRQPLATAFDTPRLALWLPMIPVAVFIGAVGASLTTWHNRKRRYELISRSRVIAAIVTAGLSIGVGLLLEGATGLLIGYLIGQVSSTAVLIAGTSQDDRDQLLSLEWREMTSELKRHRRFPAYTAPAEFVNVGVNQLPVFLLSSLFGPTPVGFFSMSNRLLGLPSTFVTGAVAEVFQQRAASEYGARGECRRTYVRAATTLAALALPPLLVLGLAAPAIFAFALGEQWRTAGEYSQVLCILFFFRLVASPLSVMFIIAERQREDLMMHVWMLISTAAAFSIGYWLFRSPRGVLLLYSINYGLIYLYYAWRGYVFARGPLPQEVDR